MERLRMQEKWNERQGRLLTSHRVRKRVRVAELACSTGERHLSRQLPTSHQGAQGTKPLSRLSHSKARVRGPHCIVDSRISKKLQTRLTAETTLHLRVSHDKCALLRFLYRPRRVSVLVKFKVSRDLYRIALAQLALDKDKLQLDREHATHSLAKAEDAVAKANAVEIKPRVTNRQTKAAPVLVLINAKLLDGTAVRLDARELVSHWKSELERLDRVAASLQQAQIELTTRHPVVSAAATLIQAAYVTLRVTSVTDNWLIGVAMEQ